MTDSKLKTNSNRILSIDILRGLTIAGMIMVNNPGGSEVYTPLDHAEWIGLTPTDLVFPFFMFIMGITTYLSLRKFVFRWSVPCARKIAKRALLLWAIGLGISWLLMFTRGMISDENASLSLGQRFLVSADTFDHIRILGVLPRLGICYGLAAIIAISVRHRFIPWIIAALFIGYFVILELGNGWAHDGTNILAIVDDAILGHNHVYRWDSPDPEGLLSTLPALGHVLIGFMVGKTVLTLQSLDDKIERLFLIGVTMALVGWLLSYGCPISKKLWTPTFSLVTCGLGSCVLALLTWVIDKRGHQDAFTHFCHVFGVNPLALYVLADLLLIPISILPLAGSETLQGFICDDLLAACLPAKLASLAWAILYVLLNWLFGLWMFKKKIYIKL